MPPLVTVTTAALLVLQVAAVRGRLGLVGLLKTTAGVSARSRLPSPTLAGVIATAVGSFRTETASVVDTPPVLTVTVAVPTPVALSRIVSRAATGLALVAPLPVGRKVTTPLLEVLQLSVRPGMALPRLFWTAAVSSVLSPTLVSVTDAGVTATFA